MRNELPTGSSRPNSKNRPPIATTTRPPTTSRGFSKLLDIVCLPDRYTAVSLLVISLASLLAVQLGFWSIFTEPLEHEQVGGSGHTERHTGRDGDQIVRTGRLSPATVSQARQSR